MSVRPALATTLKNPGNILRFFISYHLHIGFTHLLLFFDDPHDPGIEVACAFPEVTAVPNDARLRHAWRRTRAYQYQTVRDRLDVRITARQVCNVDLAIEMARELGVDWLLHIDIDELFYSRQVSAQEHFSDLSAVGIDNVFYLNHEAIPESETIVHCFRDMTLFKKNPGYLEIGRTFTPAQSRMVRSLPRYRYGFFNAYRIGKSAVRVGPTVHPMMSTGYAVHRFMDTSAPDDPPLFIGDDPMILHYASQGGFDEFITKFRRAENRKRFYQAAREAVTAGDPETARAFYREFVMMEDPAEIERLVKAGVLFRVHEIANMQL